MAFTPDDMNWAKQCRTYEEALVFIEQIRNTNRIILGGDVLTRSYKHAYINWYYDPRDKETATAESCERATEFITGLANRETYLYLFVVSPYEKCLNRQYWLKRR